MIRSTLHFTFFLIVFWYEFQPANGVCDKKWFGNNCQYKCHCQNTDCDTNGDCVAPSTCERGWFGYKCQY
ncbi:hypothetical protein BgiBS90_025928, partial [Biomphalaria glabrata]